MEIRKREMSVLFFAILFAFFSLHSLCAQNSGSYIEVRYMQRLTWIGDEYVTKYEIVIEQEVEGVFTFIQNDFTETEFIEVSLPPGNYRFRVIPYDFRDLPEPGTEWKEFAILPAAAEIPPIGISSDIKPEWKILAGEISDTETDKGKPVDFFVSAFYMPSFPLYSELTEQTLLGAAFRFGILFTRPAIFKPGVELAARWNTSGETDSYAIDTEINVLIQKPIVKGKTALMLRLGAGLTVFSIPAAPPITELFYANIDFSFLWQPFKHLYFETGFAYSHHFTQPDITGNFRPFIGIGTEF